MKNNEERMMFNFDDTKEINKNVFFAFQKLFANLNLQ